MKEIEVNEYARTKKGIIGELISETLSYPEPSEWKLKVNNSEIIIVENEDYPVKHSKQLIDLIEVGDYVNGREVKHIAMFEGFPDYSKLIFVDETHLIPDDTCENNDIKTILTKEQFDVNCYKVGGG